jgi:hypothetical protein
MAYAFAGKMFEHNAVVAAEFDDERGFLSLYQVKDICRLGFEMRLHRCRGRGDESVVSAEHQFRGRHRSKLDHAATGTKYQRERIEILRVGRTFKKTVGNRHPAEGKDVLGFRITDSAVAHCFLNSSFLRIDEEGSEVNSYAKNSLIETVIVCSWDFVS